jgi:spore maturation protein A
MLNYIWIGLITIGILTAAGYDASNELANTFRNGTFLETSFEVETSPSAIRSGSDVTLTIPASAFNAFYGSNIVQEDVRQRATLYRDSAGASTIVIPIGESSPAIWKEMAKSAATKDRLTGTIQSLRMEAASTGVVRFTLEPIRFVRMKAVTQAALDYAAMAVNISLGLIGIMALWLGVMKVAEAAGLLAVLSRFLAPVMRRLFPDVPSDHPAVGAMIMNIAANMLGLSNAATPLGLKAMEELNRLNPKLGTATNAMCTFLAINTGGLVLIPATAIAVRAAAGSINPGIIIGTSIVGAGCATVAGVLASKLLQRLPHYRKMLEAGNG